MTDETTERARWFVDAAKTDTVTERLLVGGDEYTGEFFLYGDAPIQHLRDDERPQAMLFNDMKGVGIGSKRDTVAPEGAARSVFVVTDDRVLLLVGQQDGDWTRSVPLEDVTGADYHTGLMKHRVVVDASDSQYHLWVDASYEKAALEATVALIEAGGERPSADSVESPSNTGWQVGDGSGTPGTAPDDRTGSKPDPAGGDDILGRRGGGETGGDDGAGSARGGASGAGGTGAIDDGTGFGGNGTDSGPDDGTGTAVDSGGDAGGDDPLETLRRLKDLHEKDVLTDEEFEAKKADVLDQI